MGAEAHATRLLDFLNGPDNELDAKVVVDSELKAAFPISDTVVSVTVDGCSCSLLEGLGQGGRTPAEAHVAGPGYTFRRGLAAAAMAFGGVRLRVVGGVACDEGAPRVTKLGHFLRFGLMPTDRFVDIQPEF